LGRPREVVTPRALTRELRTRRIRKALLARRRVQAVGADHDVIACRAAVRERDLDLVAAVVDRARRHAEPDASAERLSATTEHVVRSEERRVGKECRSRWYA